MQVVVAVHLVEVGMELHVKPGTPQLELEMAEQAAEVMAKVVRLLQI
jgi:hypothetical protein